MHLAVETKGGGGWGVRGVGVGWRGKGGEWSEWGGDEGGVMVRVREGKKGIRRGRGKEKGGLGGEGMSKEGEDPPKSPTAASPTQTPYHCQPHPPVRTVRRPSARLTALSALVLGQVGHEVEGARLELGQEVALPRRTAEERLATGGWRGGWYV
jgi:hypothetical protein